MRKHIVTLLTVAALEGGCIQAAPLGTAFTYQGSLADGGQPAQGLFDFRFGVFDAPTGGNALAGPITNSAVPVNNGLFTTELDFGPGVFTGQARWLEIAVRTNGAPAFVTLSPRQLLSPVPYAFYAPEAGTAQSATVASAAATVPASGVEGVLQLAQLPRVIVTNYQAGVSLSGTFSGDGVGLFSLHASHLSSGTVPDERLSTNVALRNVPNIFTALTTFSPAGGPPFAVDSTTKVTNLNADLLDALDSTAFWQTTGNTGTAPGTHYVGTRDYQALELRVNAARALRLEPTGSNSVNVLAGYGGNWIRPGVVAATIAGGGAGNYAGTAYTNRIEADAATISGGGGNSILAGSLDATIGGGVLNTIQTNAQFATITGGSLNQISSGATGATIAGGVGNLIGTNAAYAIIPGGSSCSATGAYSFAAGRRAKAVHLGAFVWADSQDADCLSLTNNHVRFRCQNGVRFSSGLSAANQNIFWNPGDAGWSVSSDRALKENFKPVDPLEVLNRLVQLPISEWNFKAYPQRHIGPTAQDFHALFPFGTDDTTLNSGDVDGVALAAIQGLNLKLERRAQALETENRALRRQLADLKATIESLAEKLNRQTP